jgi:hypothetical protein
MGLGGVENDAEFDESYMMIRRWLHNYQRGSESEIHRRNAIVLDDFLTSMIMPHKVRFFFPGRQRRMTLNQKTTSALENVNQSVKVSCGKRVTPNMSICESLKTMDIQVENVLEGRRIDAATKARSRCLHARSSTGDRVTKPCESQIAQQTVQSTFYACSLSEVRKGINRLLLKRLPEDPLYCAECEEMKVIDDQCCPIWILIARHALRALISLSRENSRLIKTNVGECGSTTFKTIIYVQVPLRLHSFLSADQLIGSFYPPC